MNKEGVDSIAKLLTDIKNSIVELEIALKNKDWDSVNRAKSNIMNLQIQIGKKI